MPPPIAGAAGQSSPPWLALAAVGSTVLAGRPDWFSTLLVCAVVPLSLLVAYPVVRRVVGDGRLRLWVALTYGIVVPEGMGPFDLEQLTSSEAGRRPGDGPGDRLRGTQPGVGAAPGGDR